MVRNKIFSNFDFKELTKTQMEVLIRMVKEELYIVQINIPYGKFHFETVNGERCSVYINRKTGNALLELGVITEIKRKEMFNKKMIYYLPSKRFLEKLKELDITKKD